MFYFMFLSFVYSYFICSALKVKELNNAVYCVMQSCSVLYVLLCGPKTRNKDSCILYLVLKAIFVIIRFVPQYFTF